MRELIHLFKYKKNDYLDKFLAGFLIEKILRGDDLKNADFIVPVPMHMFDKFKRGYNQTELLACQVSKIVGIPMLSDRLIKHKRIPSQTALSTEERFKNVKDAFTIKNSKILEGKTILLIDDIFTTGATLNECSKILRRAKVRHVNALTLACVCEV
ncbi:MAG: ComF family protein [Candidatus Ratteibacteria bacterium]|nr:ComF family protein [Candidatus Ratteibacteria bacterium]